MHLPSLIEKRRDGGELISEEIAQVISGFTRRNSRLPEEHAGDGNFFPRHERQGTWHLTKAMLESGQYSSIHQTRRPRSTNTRPAQLAERLHSFWHRCWPAMKVWVQ